MSSPLNPRFSAASRGEDSPAALLLSAAKSYDKHEKFEGQQKKRLQVRLLVALIIIILPLVFFRSSANNTITLGSLPSISGGGRGEEDLESYSSSGDHAGNGLDHDTWEDLIADNRLLKRVRSLDAKVREHKTKPNMIMETDPEGLRLTKELQQWTYKLIAQRYGPYKIRVKMDLLFPESIPDFKEKGPKGQVTIEMASARLIPCSVFSFLEIARTWKGGAFHRNANHVLQAQGLSEVTKSLPFQEYSPEHPHKLGSTGYAGRPSGPGFYISIKDNTINHGPGSQQKVNPHEADANFGDVVEGLEDVVQRIHSVPQEGWLDTPNMIKIVKMTIVYNKEDGTGEWHEWGVEDETKKINKAKYEPIMGVKRLADAVADLGHTVRMYRPTEGMHMETDPVALKMERELQQLTKTLILSRYGKHAFRVALDLDFPPSTPDYKTKGKTGKVVFQLAPVKLIPCSVFHFLEIARTFKSGAFIRNANHVLQASVKSKVKTPVPFQEYSPEHPHKQWSTGYVGRESGPDFYISIMDNIKSHGPGSRKYNKYEAESNFGDLVEGMEEVAMRIHSVPKSGVWEPVSNQVRITNMTILIDEKLPDGSTEWKDWKASS